MTIIIGILCIVFFCIGIAFFSFKSSSVRIFLVVIVISPLAMAYLLLFERRLIPDKLLNTSRAVQKLVMMAQFLNPESDMWVPLKEVKILPGKTSYNFDIVHSYMGDYDIDLICQSEPSLDDSLDFSMTMSFYENTTLVKSVLSNHAIPFLSRHGGFILAWYDVPNDIAYKKRLFVTIELIFRTEIMERYGQCSLFVGKGSDE